MDRNIRIARELVRLAKSLVAETKEKDIESELTKFNTDVFNEFTNNLKNIKDGDKGIKNVVSGGAEKTSPI